jgi:putative membrane protein
LTIRKGDVMTELTTALSGVLASETEHGWWPIWPLLWVAVIGTVVWLLLRRRRAAEGPSGESDRAKEILAERFARGEITSEEYRERLDQLQ